MSAPPPPPPPAPKGIKSSYQLAWLAIWALFGAFLFWTLGGRSWYRRRFVGLNEPAESERRSQHFVAIAVPRISRSDEKFTLRPSEFAALIRGLAKEGYCSIGLSDVRDFYERKRPLPQRAVLIALDRDDPSSVAFADEALESARMKGVCFLNKTYYGQGRIRRHSLTPHAVRDLLASGAWEFGWFSDEPMPPPKDMAGAPVLDNSTTSAWTRDCSKYPFRFSANQQGYNGPESSLCGLRIMPVRGDRTPQENLRAIDANWPRTKPFFDDFRADKLGADWIAGWGVISAAHNRLAVIPTPRQTSASVFLNGTDDWTDQVVEMTLKKYRKSFWAYLRYREGVSFVRVGAKNGFWKVEEKPAANLPPKTLAAAPIGSLPARLWVVVKNQSLLVHVNDRLVFRKGQDIDPRIAKGRVALVAFDVKRKEAIGIITSFRAAPLPERWLSFGKLASDLDEPTAVRLHDLAVVSRVLSPRWFTIQPDGHVLTTGGQLELVRALSGFNRCQLAPSVDFAGGRLDLPRGRGALEKLIAALTAAAADVSADGVNLRIPAGADPRTAARFAARLRDALHAQRRRLWVTLPGAGPPDGAWTMAVDGVLKPGPRPLAGAQLLELYDMEAAPSGRGPG